MRVPPQTARKDGRKKRPAWLLPAIVGLLGLVLVVGILRVLLDGAGFEVGEKTPGDGVEDIVVSGEDTLYPPPDVETFSVAPAALHVYLVVEGLAADELEASVERSGRATVVSWVLSEPSELEVGDEREERLVRDGGSVSGLIKFSIRSPSGDTITPGDYTVRVQSATNDTLVAEKSFVVLE